MKAQPPVALVRNPNLPKYRLTDREVEVLKLLASGNSNKQVACRLGLSTRTVETHRARIMLKLRVNSFCDLVHYALRNNLVQP